MRRKLRSQLDDPSLDEPLINLTPLIDVVFVVLITFMLIAPALDIDSVDLATGPQKNSAPFENGPLAITVHADNSIWFHGKSLSLAQLENQLREEKKRNPKAIPQLIHDSRAQFGTYQSLKNSLEGAGFEQMEVILKPN